MNTALVSPLVFINFNIKSRLTLQRRLVVILISGNYEYETEILVIPMDCCMSRRIFSLVNGRCHLLQSINLLRTTVCSRFHEEDKVLIVKLTLTLSLTSFKTKINYKRRDNISLVVPKIISRADKSVQQIMLFLCLPLHCGTSFLLNSETQGPVLIINAN